MLTARPPHSCVGAPSSAPAGSRSLSSGALRMEEANDGLWKVGDPATAMSKASQVFPAVVRGHAVSHRSPGRGFPPCGYPPEIRPHGGKALSQAKGGRWSREQTGGGGWAWACGQRHREAPVSPSRVPITCPQGQGPPVLGSHSFPAAMLCPQCQWSGLSPAAALAWLPWHTEPGGGQEPCSGGSPRMASGKCAGRGGRS